MSLTHALYIPLTILLGLVPGYLLGARTARAEERRQQDRSHR